jgi:hypothetical protein
MKLASFAFIPAFRRWKTDEKLHCNARMRNTFAAADWTGGIAKLRETVNRRVVYTISVARVLQSTLYSTIDGEEQRFYAGFSKVAFCNCESS